MTSFLPGLRDRSKYGAYCAEKSDLTISGDEVKGSVDARRTSEVRQESAAADRGELLVCVGDGADELAFPVTVRSNTGRL